MFCDVLDVFVVVYQDFLRFSAVDIVVFRLSGTYWPCLFADKYLCVLSDIERGGWNPQGKGGRKQDGE